MGIGFMVAFSEIYMNIKQKRANKKIEKRKWDIN